VSFAVDRGSLRWPMERSPGMGWRLPPCGVDDAGPGRISAARGEGDLLFSGQLEIRTYRQLHI
jgi:hypothetical protein